MLRQDIRNVAIIAHVDHGKTSMVDQLLKQGGQLNAQLQSQELIMDRNPLERERGITILSKNCAVDYVTSDGKSIHINLVDTPGHADFSGEVERVLRMADGALLLIDAYEGVMPQTRYVLAKALEEGLKPLVVLNKMDRPEARPEQVVEEVFDLLVELNANDEALDFPVIYASAKQGWASRSVPGAGEKPPGHIHALLDAVITHVPAPDVDAEAPLQVLITSIDYNDYVGRVGIGRVFAGTLRENQAVVSIDRHGRQTRQRTGHVFHFSGLDRKQVSAVPAGDLCAIVGLDPVELSDTLTDPQHPMALPAVTVDEPTMHMTFRINDGPMAGLEGSYVTRRQLGDRLERELRHNMALRVEDRGESFVVSGRGLLHLGILLENMRREGYELTVGKPEVILKEVDGKKLEPVERLAIDVASEHVGAVMQLVGERGGEIFRMDPVGERTHLRFLIPARGLIGLRSRLLTATRGEVVMHHRFQTYGPIKARIPRRTCGVMVAANPGRVTAYALDQLADRGVSFVRPGDEVYEGQIVGEHNKDNDIVVNITRQKQLTNMRSVTKDTTVTLKTPRIFSLEDALEYVEVDERVELTPKAIRLRKHHLHEHMRKREGKAASARQGGA